MRKLALALAIGAGLVLASQPAPAQTFSVEQIERRIVLGFQANPDALQHRLPSPWQLNALSGGPLQGANLLIVLVDNLRTEDPEGKSKTNATLRFIVFVAPAVNPETGQTVSVVLGGLASNPVYVPGYYQVYRAATVKIEHSIRSRDGESDEQTDAWEALDANGKVEMALNLQSLPEVAARVRNKGEANVISAKDPTLWRIYKTDAGTDTVKSVPQGIDRIRNYTLRVNMPEVADLFDGREKLLGINLLPWYVRQVFIR